MLNLYGILLGQGRYSYATVHIIFSLQVQILHSARVIIQPPMNPNAN